MIITMSLHASIINVKDLGAKGDGKTDDTAAFQNAIYKSKLRSVGGVLYIPAGRYIISETLKLDRAFGLIIRGEGAMGYKAGYSNGLTSQSILIWNGKPDGILFHAIGCFGNSYENLAFHGKGPGMTQDSRAGILFLNTTLKGCGNMINRFSNISFSHAKIGMQMGSKDTQKSNDSDINFESVHFGTLDVGFKTYHEQAVDYTFTFVFGLNCKTVFDFQRGGNILVNTAQLTNCNTVLYIGRCGANNGLFLLNNVRLEASSKWLQQGLRGQLLKTNKNVDFAIIRFNNYCDAQWFWFKQKPQPQTPLCEISPGVYVEISNSVFQGPLAQVNGNKTKKGRLLVRNSLFRYITPEKAVKMNEYGRVKLIDNVNSNMELYDDVIKWNGKK